MCAGRRGRAHVPAKPRRGGHSALLQQRETFQSNEETGRTPAWQGVGTERRRPSVVPLQSTNEGRLRNVRPKQQLVPTLRLGTRLAVSVLLFSSTLWNSSEISGVWRNTANLDHRQLLPESFKTQGHRQCDSSLHHLDCLLQTEKVATLIFRRKCKNDLEGGSRSLAQFNRP